MTSIGKLKIKHGLMLAPMAGVTDRTFRKICREFGAEYTVSEMISAKALYYGDTKTDLLAHFSPDEHPIGLQIFGSDADIMAFAAEKLIITYSPDVIDINMGCPVHKIVSNGDGSALMKNPDLAKRIVEKVKEAAVKVSGTDFPVTVKIRAGYEAKNKNAVDFAKKLEEAGADALCVHGRTRDQFYAPPVDINIIGEVKAALNIPVIGNGGIICYDDAQTMLDVTHCDGLMLAQGVCGNPWLFDEISKKLDGLPYTPPTNHERIAVAKRHTEMLIEDKGKFVGIREARKHLSWYLSGFHGATTARDMINHSEDIETVFGILDNVLQRQNNE